MIIPYPKNYTPAFKIGDLVETNEKYKQFIIRLSKEKNEEIKTYHKGIVIDVIPLLDLRKPTSYVIIEGGIVSTEGDFKKVV